MNFIGGGGVDNGCSPDGPDLPAIFGAGVMLTRCGATLNAVTDSLSMRGVVEFSN